VKREKTLFVFPAWAGKQKNMPFSVTSVPPAQRVVNKPLPSSLSCCGERVLLKSYVHLLLCNLFPLDVANLFPYEGGGSWFTGQPMDYTWQK
jgi:hypothetical protein